jgi:hypothetical protein
MLYQFFRLVTVVVGGGSSRQPKQFGSEQTVADNQYGSVEADVQG